MTNKTEDELVGIKSNIDRLEALGVPGKIIDELREWLEQEKRRE